VLIVNKFLIRMIEKSRRMREMPQSGRWNWGKRPSAAADRGYGNRRLRSSEASINAIKCGRNVQENSASRNNLLVHVKYPSAATDKPDPLDKAGQMPGASGF